MSKTVGLPPLPPRTAPILTFALGMMLGQLLLSLVVGIPTAVAFALTKDASDSTRIIFSLLGFALGLMAVGGIANGIGSLRPVSWWFIYGACFPLLLRPLPSFTKGDSFVGFSTLAAVVAEAAALAIGFRLGRRRLAQADSEEPGALAGPDSAGGPV